VIVGGVAVIAFVALTHLLRELQVILVPFVLAGFLYFSLSPLLDYLVRRLRWPGFLAIPATFVLALFVTAAAGTVLTVSAVEMAQNTDRYTRELRRTVDTLEAYVPFDLLTLTGRPEAEPEPSGDAVRPEGSAVPPAEDPAHRDLDLDGVPAELDADEYAPDEVPSEAAERLVAIKEARAKAIRAGADPEEVVAAQKQAAEGERGALADYLVNLLQKSIGPAMQGIAQATLGVVSNGLLVLILMFFMMLGRVVSVKRSGGFTAQIEGGVKGYVILKTLISAVTGLAQGMVLALLGVEFAVVFGLLGFLFNFIPNIGPFLATLAPIPLVLVQDGIPVWVAVLAIGLPGLIHFTSGVLETRFMGERFDVHPVVVMLGLMYFGLVWGIVGAFLSTPILAVVRILCAKSEAMYPVALVLAGKLDEVWTHDGPAPEVITEPPDEPCPARGPLGGKGELAASHPLAPDPEIVVPGAKKKPPA
jgi:AI-2 transport protein TqsA